MIYRIAIKDEQGKFLRYANVREMKYLRVSVDGKVEKLIVNTSIDVFPPRFPLLDIALENDSDDETISIYGAWQDVSATHEVEWGTIDLHKPIYVNDIMRKSKQKEYQRDMYDIDDIIYRLIEGNFSAEDVIGNINENPELLEVKG